MPSTLTDLHDTGISLGELQVAIRQNEELGLGLIEIGCCINSGVEANFSNYREVEDSAPLPVRLEPIIFSDEPDAARDFIASRSGDFISAAMLKIQAQPLFVAAYRGTLSQPAPVEPVPVPVPAPLPVPAPTPAPVPAPEPIPVPAPPMPPQPAPVPPEPPRPAAIQLPIPKHAWPFFGPDRAGDWGGIPWERMTPVPFQLAGLTGSRVYRFQNAAGETEAFILVTDADVDTDGPGGCKGDDPDWLPGTSLSFPGPVCCDSRRFPGVVRSARLLQHFGLNMGDFGLGCFAGNIDAFQVYDQGDDDKIGEISIFLARQLGTVPPDRDDHWAATRGNNTTELVTLFFSRTGSGRALDNAAIRERASECWQSFTGRLGDVTKPASQPAAKLLADVARAQANCGEPHIFSTEEWGARPARVSFSSRQA